MGVGSSLVSEQQIEMTSEKNLVGEVPFRPTKKRTAFLQGRGGCEIMDGGGGG